LKPRKNSQKSKFTEQRKREKVALESMHHEGVSILATKNVKKRIYAKDGRNNPSAKNA